MDIKATREQLEKLVEDTLLILEYSTPIRFIGSKKHRVKLNEFRNLEYLGSQLDDLYKDWFVFEDTYLDALESFDQGVIKRNEEGLVDHSNIDLDKEFFFSIVRVNTLKPSEVRGMVTKLMPFMVMIRTIGMAKDGTYTPIRQIYGCQNNKSHNWEPLNIWDSTRSHFKISYFKTRDFEIPQDALEKARDLIRMNAAIAFRNRYQWRVSFKINEASIAFPTDPTGIKELFKDRDKNQSSNRRDILLHWVQQHFRENRFDPEIEIYVREHMRAHRKFEWHGLTCEIIPCKFDIEKNEQLRIQRAAMNLK